MAPALMCRDLTSDDVSQRRANRNRNVEDRECVVALLRSEGVRDEARADRGITRFTDAYQHAKQEQPRERRRVTGQYGAEAPDENAERNQPFPRGPIAQVAKDRRCDKIADHENCVDASKVPVAQMKLLLDGREHRRDNVAVKVIEKVQPREDEQHPAGRKLSVRHGQHSGSSHLMQQHTGTARARTGYSFTAWSFLS